MHVSHTRAAQSFGVLLLTIIGATGDGSGWLEPNPHPVRAGGRVVSFEGAIDGSGWLEPIPHVQTVTGKPPTTPTPTVPTALFPARPLPAVLTRPPTPAELPKPAPVPTPKPKTQPDRPTASRKQASGADYPTGWGWWPIMYADGTRATVYGYSDGLGRVILE